MQRFGIAHRFVDTHEMERPGYRANGPERCYHCKSELFEVLGRLRDELGFDAVAYGVNPDDTGDFRPGHRAAEERGVLSPFLDVALGKAEIRALSRAAELPTADLPASACLASRLPYGMEVTQERLAQVEQAEERLRALGFRQLRVRHHGAVARVEIEPDGAAARARSRGRARDRRGAEAARLPLRRARPRGLPHGRAQRGAAGEARLVSGAPAGRRCAGAPRDLGLDQGRGRRATRSRAALRESPRAPALRRAPRARDLERFFPHHAERTQGLALGARVPAARARRAPRASCCAGDGGLARRGGRRSSRRSLVTRAGRARAPRAARPTTTTARSSSRSAGARPRWIGVNEHGLAATATALPAADGALAGCAAPAQLLVQDVLQRFDSVEKAADWALRRPAGGTRLAAPRRRLGPHRRGRASRDASAASLGAGDGVARRPRPAAGDERVREGACETRALDAEALARLLAEAASECVARRGRRPGGPPARHRTGGSSRSRGTRSHAPEAKR